MNGCQIVDLSHSLKKESDVMGEADDLPRKNLYLLLNPDGSLPLIIRRRKMIVMNQILHSLGLRSTGLTTSSSRHWLEQNMRNIIMAMAMILVICKMSQESFGSFLSGSKLKKETKTLWRWHRYGPVVGFPLNLTFPAGRSHLCSSA